MSVQQPEGKMLKTYASATSLEMFPSKEQAIVIEKQDGLTIKDYVGKLATIISPNDIRFVSRIANNRICVFLSSKIVAKKLTDNHSTIKINNFELGLRPLINKQRRVIISNVCPVVPHSVIEAELSKLNIKTSSKISFIKAGISDPGYSHIMSFRRQVFIDPNDIDKLPTSTPIFFEDTTYRIYFSTDNVCCFICSQAGHLANQCPKKNISPDGIEQIDHSISETIPKASQEIIDNKTNANVLIHNDRNFL